MIMKKANIEFLMKIFVYRPQPTKNVFTLNYNFICFATSATSQTVMLLLFKFEKSIVTENF